MTDDASRQPSAAPRPGRAIAPPRKQETSGEVAAASCSVAAHVAGGRPDGVAAAARTAPTPTTSGPVVFIDVDGVLNAAGQPDDADLFYPDGFEAAMRENYLVLSAERLSRFAAFVARHDCRIVLCTSWRLDVLPKAALLTAFAAHGIQRDRVLGDTPDLSQVCVRAAWPLLSSPPACANIPSCAALPPHLLQKPRLSCASTPLPSWAKPLPSCAETSSLSCYTSSLLCYKYSLLSCTSSLRCAADERRLIPRRDSRRRDCQLAREQRPS